MTRGTTAIMAKMLIIFIRGYQRFVSPLLGANCRFSPTCSAYAIEAVQAHGAIRGTILSIWRVLRCNPWGRQGHDPVPARKPIFPKPN